MAKAITSTDIEKYLSGADFPCEKQELIQHAKEKNANKDIITALNGLPSRSYQSTTDVLSEFSVSEEEEGEEDSYDTSM
jgi:hypothetical protein